VPNTLLRIVGLVDDLMAANAFSFNKSQVIYLPTNPDLPQAISVFFNYFFGV
jgi:hypothetical protein